MSNADDTARAIKYTGNESELVPTEPGEFSQDTDTAQKATKTESPEPERTTTTTVIVIISVLLSMFLVALDRTILSTV